jgi:hypothetical protein
MHLLNSKKINIIGHITGPDGTQYPPNWFLDPAERERVGIIEVPDPIYPDPELFTYTENPDGSLTITERTPEDIAAQQANKVAYLKQQIINAVQQRLDTFAQSRGYDNILSACTYVTSSVPKFAAEGAYAVSRRDATWAALYGVMADVEGGSTPMPTSFADIETLLPELIWPKQ